jgi:hypothetical protein
MFCGKCGKANAECVGFCIHCGADLGRQTQLVAAAPEHPVIALPEPVTTPRPLPPVMRSFEAAPPIEITPTPPRPTGVRVSRLMGGMVLLAVLVGLLIYSRAWGDKSELAGMTWTVEPADPVIGPGANGTASYGATILRENGLYKAWHNDGMSPGSIMYTTSPDGINWQRSIRVYTPRNQLPQPHLAKRDNTYYLWMGNCGRGVELATSRDGLNWVFQANIPNLGNSQAMVVGPDNKFLAWYPACAGEMYYRLATSEDGIHWSDQGCVFPRGAAGEYDYYLGTLEVVRIGDLYHLWYACGPGGGAGSSRLGYATSPDGIHWQKHGPVGGTINAYQNVSYPTIMRDGNILHMWFSKDSTQDVYHATAMFGDDSSTILSLDVGSGKDMVTG